jgi:uncharacterized protein YndB with AHSA1/START domain
MKALKRAALVLVAAVAAVVAIASTRPDDFRIERSLRIDAPAERIYPLVNDLHRHLEWSPFEKKDPAMARRHSGAPAGPGAIYEWNGNAEIGSGRMEILESEAPERVAIQLDFFTPFEAHNTAEFLLRPDGDATTVTWAMYGPQLFMGKVMSVFVDVDAMIGREFEAGLANLDAVTKSQL